MKWIIIILSLHFLLDFVVALFGEQLRQFCKFIRRQSKGIITRWNYQRGIRQRQKYENIVDFDTPELLSDEDVKMYFPGIENTNYFSR